MQRGCQSIGSLCRGILHAGSLQSTSVVARRAGGCEFFLYVGKTGDNRAGCNPVISRAGNHFSYNVVHSQLRNKVPDPHLCDYEFFYVTFDTYDAENRQKVDVINEMERAANRELQSRLTAPAHGAFAEQVQGCRLYWCGG